MKWTGDQTIKISDELTVHALPARHFSGRGLKNATRPYGPASCSSPAEKIYYSAIACGPGPHFKAIGEQFGPIDPQQSWKTVNMTRTGKYIHMMPESGAGRR